MDKQVLEAMQRWPDVPAVFGWLSLDRRGVWRLHEDGNAGAGGAGGAITNVQIIEFINRNYACDEQGRWFFQNGPQRVYVRLDGAPYVLRSTGDVATGLETHTGLAVSEVKHWLADDTGSLYASVPAGGAIVADRDLQLLSEQLLDQQGATLLQLLEDHLSTPETRRGYPPVLTPARGGFSAAPLRFTDQRNIETELGFIANPEPA